MEDSQSPSPSMPSMPMASTPRDTLSTLVPSSTLAPPSATSVSPSESWGSLVDNSNTAGADGAVTPHGVPKEPEDAAPRFNKQGGRLSPRWVKGQSGNPKGRPKGSRDKLGEKFVYELEKHWRKYGSKAVQEVYESRPDVYLKVIASLLPKQLQAEVDLSVTSHEARVAERQKFIEDFEAKLIDVTPSSDSTLNEVVPNKDAPPRIGND
jgi:hypothetical protein